MATVKSTEYTNETSTPVVLSDARTYGGTVHQKTATLSATMVAGDVAQMMSVKKGDRIIAATLKCAALNTASTVQVNAPGETVGVLIAPTVATAALMLHWPVVLPLPTAGVGVGGTAGLGYVVTADGTLDLQLNAATASQTVAASLTVLYVPMGG